MKFYICDTPFPDMESKEERTYITKLTEGQFYAEPETPEEAGMILRLAGVERDPKSLVAVDIHNRIPGRPAVSLEFWAKAKSIEIVTLSYVTAPDISDYVTARRVYDYVAGQLEEKTATTQAA